jgi:hypothetical protein
MTQDRSPPGGPLRLCVVAHWGKAPPRHCSPGKVRIVAARGRLPGLRAIAHQEGTFRVATRRGEPLPRAAGASAPPLPHGMLPISPATFTWSSVEEEAARRSRDADEEARMGGGKEIEPVRHVMDGKGG